MVLLIAGATHTGKTALAQRVLEQYKMPYLSLDHLKMGLIRSGETALSVEDDEALTEYLWKITREIIKTAVENKQNLTIEGIYIPFDWAKDFCAEYLPQVRYACLVMTKAYIENYFDDIVKYSGVVEDRLDESYLTREMLIADNEHTLEMCRKHECKYILIDGEYDVKIDL